VGFEIFLKFQRFGFVREGGIPNQLPRLEFRGVRGFASIVVWDRPLQIGGRADVLLLRVSNAAG
jgi:hypothetical protein